MKKLVTYLILGLMLITPANAAKFSGGHLIERFATITSAGGTTTLTATSERHQVVSGSSSQNVKLPDATTAKTGMSFTISNKSSGVVTVQYNDSSTLTTLNQNEFVDLLLTSTGTSNGTWDSKKAVSGAGGLYDGGQNLIDNNSFESSTSSWVASGSSVLARVTTAAHIVPPGVASGSWDASAASETLSYAATTITANDGLSGRNGVLSCAVKTTATDIKMQVYDGSSVISPNAATDVVPSSSAGFVRYSVNFIFPSSGTVQARFLSQSNSAIAYIDDCFFGLADGFNVINVSQAQFIGSGYVASTANCTPARTNTALGAFTDDTDCPGVTVESNPGPGTLQTTDTDNLDFTFTNLPPGRYLVVAQLSASASSDWAVAINDGTTTSGVANGNGNASTAFQPSITLTGNFVYTSAGDRTFSIWGSSGSGAITIHGNGANGRMSINVYRYPLTSELGYRADLQPATWSGTHGNDCSWSAVTTSLGDPSDDGSCTFTEKTNVNFGSVSSYGSKKPGITFTPNRAGTYQVCGTASYSGNNETTAVGIALYDGSTQMGYFGVNASTKNPITICGNVVASSVSSKTVSFQLEDGASTEGVLSAGGNGMAVVWNITLISTNIPSPVLVGSVLSNSSGATKTISATLNCDAGSTITSQSGTTSDGIATINNISSGVCAGTFASGTFSATPYSCNADIKGSTLDSDARIDATSATAFNLYCITPSTGAAAASCDVTVSCSGPR